METIGHVVRGNSERAHVERQDSGPFKLSLEDDRFRLYFDHLLPDEHVPAPIREEILLFQLVVHLAFPPGDDGGSEGSDRPVRGRSRVDDHDSVCGGEFRGELGGGHVTCRGGSDDDDVEHGGSVYRETEVCV